MTIAALEDELAAVPVPGRARELVEVELAAAGRDRAAALTEKPPNYVRATALDATVGELEDELAAVPDPGRARELVEEELAAARRDRDEELAENPPNYSQADELAQTTDLGFARAERVFGEAIVEVRERELAAFRDVAGLADPFRSTGKATHDLFARVEMALAVASEKLAGRGEGLAFPETDERIEESTIPGCRAAHVTGRHDWDAMRLGHRGRATPDAFDARIEQMRDVDRELVAENVPGTTQKRGPQPLVTSQQHTPFPGQGFDLAPVDPNPMSCARVAGFELLVTSSMGEGQESTQTSPAFGGLHEQEKPIGMAQRSPSPGVAT